MEKISSQLLSFVLRSKDRVKILELLSYEKLIPSQIMKKLEKYQSHTSRTIKQLEEKKLIVCDNPSDLQFKFYTITPIGVSVLKEVKKILKEIK